MDLCYFAYIASALGKEKLSLWVVKTVKIDVSQGPRVIALKTVSGFEPVCSSIATSLSSKSVIFQDVFLLLKKPIQPFKSRR